MKEKTLQWLDENSAEFYDLSDGIWAKAELGMEEEESAEMLASLLEQYGFEATRGVAGMPTAFIASWGRGRPVVAFNAEYDALPGLSQEVGWAKKPIKEGAPGHGCGHNVLGAAAVKAAVGLKHYFELKGSQGATAGTIKVFGTPAEELCIGKPFMAAKGLFNDIDVFLDWHPKYMNRACAEGCNAYFNVKYHFTGKTCHGAMPWEGKSAFDAAVIQGHSVEMFREHLNPGRPPEAANTINYVYGADGMSSPNVVPQKATAWYVGRMTDSELLLKVMKKLDDCAQAAALVTETQVSREFITATHERVTNEAVSRVMYENLLKLGPPVFDEEEQAFARRIQRECGTEETGLSETIEPYGEIHGQVQDTSEYSWFAPYALLRLTMSPVGTGWHNWAVAACAGSSIAHKTLDTASRILTATAIDLAENPDILEEAKAEWQKKRGDKAWMDLLPENAEPDLHPYRQL